MQGTRRDASTPIAALVGAERSLVQIQSPDYEPRSADTRAERNTILEQPAWMGGIGLLERSCEARFVSRRTGSRRLNAPKIRPYTVMKTLAASCSH